MFCKFRFKVGAVTWWEDYGADSPELQRLAIRILSQGCSSSSCERLWSSFAHIHTKKRNRLEVHRANDLVFVNANLRLLNKMRQEYTHDKYIGFHRPDGTNGTDDDDDSMPEEEVEVEEEDPIDPPDVDV